MKYLAIDTSSKNLTVLLKTEKELLEHNEVCGVRHSENLMPVIERLIEQGGLKLSELDFVACCVGAGSFTGIRIGVSTVKAICFCNNLPALAITSFDCLAYNREQGKVLAVIDAGHNGFYVAGYDNLKVVLQPSYILKEQLLQLQDEYSFIAEAHIDGLEVEVVDKFNGFKMAIEKKSALKDGNLDNLIPLYVRKSQAEEGR